MSVSHARREGAGQQVISALRKLFGRLVDPRAPQGVRHELASVLTVTVLAALAGAGNFREAGDRAGDLPEQLLRLAGARIGPRTGRPEAPSGPRSAGWCRVSTPYMPMRWWGRGWPTV